MLHWLEVLGLFEMLSLRTDRWNTILGTKLQKAKKTTFVSDFFLLDVTLIWYLGYSRSSTGRHIESRVHPGIELVVSLLLSFAFLLIMVSTSVLGNLRVGIEIPEIQENKT